MLICDIIRVSRTYSLTVSLQSITTNSVTIRVKVFQSHPVNSTRGCDINFTIVLAKYFAVETYQVHVKRGPRRGCEILFYTWDHTQSSLARLSPSFQDKY